MGAETEKTVVTAIVHDKEIKRVAQSPPVSYQDVTITIVLPKGEVNPWDANAEVDGNGNIVVTCKVPPDDW